VKIGSLGRGIFAAIETERRPTPIVDNSSSQRASPLNWSSTARARAEAAAQPRFGALSVAAHGDADLATQLAHDFAHIVQQPSVDVTEWAAGTGPMRYSATGEPVTQESTVRYANMMQDFQAESLALYKQELAKGTNHADIFDKLIALGDSKSEEFRGITNWEGKVQ
jgi:hypothetical protein